MLIEMSERIMKKLKVDLFNDRLWFGCQKLTWPMDGFEKDDIAGNVAEIGRAHV